MRTPRPSYYTTVPNADPAVKRIFAELKAQQCTVLDLAARCGVDRCTIGRWKREPKAPNLYNVRAALNALGLDLRVVLLNKEKLDDQSTREP